MGHFLSIEHQVCIFTVLVDELKSLIPLPGSLRKFIQIAVDSSNFLLDSAGEQLNLFGKGPLDRGKRRGVLSDFFNLIPK